MLNNVKIVPSQGALKKFSHNYLSITYLYHTLIFIC